MDFSSESPKRTNNADILILNFHPPDCERINFFGLSHPLRGNLL
jgi:hypothetical protein